MYRPFPLGKEAVSAEIFWRPHTATKVSVEAGLTANYGGSHGASHADSLDNRSNAPPYAHQWWAASTAAPAPDGRERARIFGRCTIESPLKLITSMPGACFYFSLTAFPPGLSTRTDESRMPEHATECRSENSWRARR